MFYYYYLAALPRKTIIGVISSLKVGTKKGWDNLRIVFMD